ncbi:signal transduction histidine kinase [Roseimicrobium gellanilyticum]|uniref:histidine kinase n=1 Tax=Roseimicrobium gellanilyticum TaxID=748857 RepID=A0A366HN47_9BACT|nr:signal transduction histidine kinase [Roseimicrobium gellanilyticum]
MLVGSILLVALTWWSVREDESRDFAALARTNAEFLRRMTLPPSERMASQLGEVLNVSVYFRHRDTGILTPAPTQEILQRGLSLVRLPADGWTHAFEGLEAVAIPIGDLRDLVFVRPEVRLPAILQHPRTLAMLGVFWFLALAFGWALARGLVLPLRHLAKQLPAIETPGPISLPEASRQDEIGDVARAFLRTREALQSERVQRAQAEKLAVLGRMTAALAHEIQNPVSAIKMHAQLWPGGEEEGRITAKTIEHEAARIESLVSQWMYLSKPQPPTMRRVDLATVLRQVLQVHQPQLEHAQIHTSLEVPAEFTVRGDSRRLAQVFSNLLVNAIQAMPMGGTLRVEGISDEKGTTIAFMDSGKGFSKEALSRFSEFFFTEKEGGMGIGLSVAAEIVKAHQGELRVENREQGGASVLVLLPPAKQ